MKKLNKRTTTVEAPKFGEGVFLSNDVSEILNLPYRSVKHLMFEYWGKRFDISNEKKLIGEKGNQSVNFLTLIEFYTYYKLRKAGISAHKIQKYYQIISTDLNTKYPFARKIRTDGKDIWYEKLGELIKADGKKQFDLEKIIGAFLQRIEFGTDYAERLYLLSDSKNVVVDPKHQFGQPTITGTNIRADVIKKLFEAGETKKSISKLYNLTPKQISDALRYYKKAA